MSNRPKSHVYFARCISWNGADLDAIKIGLSVWPQHRVRAVASQQPFVCELIGQFPGDMFAEYFVHMWLRQHKLGGEFFKAEGEVLRLADHARKTGELPFPIFEENPNRPWTFQAIRIDDYMERHSITFDDIEADAGVAGDYHRKHFARGGGPNRRFLAALAVCAVKRGLEVHWPLDFIPPRQIMAAAA